MKSRLTDLIRRLILEEVAATRVLSRLSTVSVDDQIDGMLVQFEDSSSRVNEGPLPEMSLRFLLEKEGDDRDEGAGGQKASEEDEDPEGPGALEKPGSVTSSKIDADKPVDPRRPKIDLNYFASRTARLVENYDNLLDVPSVIVNRAVNFLTENYGPDEAQFLRITLEREYGISLEPRDDEPERPAAQGAGPV